MAFYLCLFSNIYKWFYLLFVCPNFNCYFPAPNHHRSFIMQLLELIVMLHCCFWTVKHHHWTFYFISDIWLHCIDIYLPKVANNVVILISLWLSYSDLPLFKVAIFNDFMLFYIQILCYFMPFWSKFYATLYHFGVNFMLFHALWPIWR